MMKKLTNIYLTLIAALLLLAGCSETSEDTAGKTSPSVYIAVTQATGGTVQDGTINTDNTYYEDRVHDLAMLVFDSSTGEKVAEYYESDIPMTGSNTFVIKLIPGQRDFYFVANMPDMENTLQGITKETDLNTTYMNTLRNLDAALYQGATSDKGFPMSRVYLNQTVSTGGSIYQPAPFTPDGEDQVKLIRVTAKLEVSFALNGTAGNIGVQSVTLHNANAQYCLTNPSTTPASSYTDPVTLTREGSSNTYYCYMPESIISSAAWSATGNNQPINYFTIETTEGKTYDVPIITDDAVTNDYLEKATGNYTGYTPPYTIYRNHDYKYTVNNLQTIEILYSVNDWNMVDKSLYMGYGYNVEVDGTTVTIKNTMQECTPYKVTITPLGGATFDDGTTASRDFTVTDSKASISYTLNAIPATGPYLQVDYNGKPVKTFSK
nr:hypothetical protein [uncultured Prevotella sp.]